MNEQRLHTCPICEKAFAPSKMWQTYCSVKCRNTFHNKKVTIKSMARRVRLVEDRIRVVEGKEKAQHEWLRRIMDLLAEALPPDDERHYRLLWEKYDSARDLAQSQIEQQQDVASPGSNGAAADS